MYIISYVHLFLCSPAPILSCVHYILGGGGGGFLTLFGVPGVGDVVKTPTQPQLNST